MNLEQKKLLAQLEKKFKLKNYQHTCFAFGCSKKAIESHSQTESLVARLCDNNKKVYGLARSFFDFCKYPIKLTPISQSSVFKGFCNDHDTKLFSTIDQQKNQIDDKDAFLYFFRALCYEQFRKELAFQKYEFQLNQISKEFSTKDILDLAHYIGDIKYKIQGIQLFLNKDIKRLRMILEKIQATKEFNQIKYFFMMTNKLPVSISTLFNPLFDEYQAIYDYPIQPLMSLNIVPLQTKSIVCIAWIDKYSSYMKNFFDELTELGVERILNILSFLESEDVIIQPSFFDSLNEVQKNNLINCIAMPHEEEKKLLWDKFPVFFEVDIFDKHEKL